MKERTDERGEVTMKSTWRRVLLLPVVR